jgi:lipopolysaccharide export system protein LptC
MWYLVLLILLTSKLVWIALRKKQTNKSIKGVNRSSYKLEIIHTNIYSPDMDSHD